MSSADAIRTLQHASQYIFVSGIATAPGRSMRKKKMDLWQAMATLHECRNSVEQDGQTEVTPVRRIKNLRPALVCSLGV